MPLTERPFLYVMLYLLCGLLRLERFQSPCPSILYLTLKGGILTVNTRQFLLCIFFFNGQNIEGKNPCHLKATVQEVGT